MNDIAIHAEFRDNIKGNADNNEKTQKTITKDNRRRPVETIEDIKLWNFPKTQFFLLKDVSPTNLVFFVDELLVHNLEEAMIFFK